MAEMAPFPQPAQLDYTNRRACTLHMRELLSLAKLLANGFDYEWSRLRSILLREGYSRKDLQEMTAIAASNTIYEQVIPRNIPEVGDRQEYNGNRERWRK